MSSLPPNLVPKGFTVSNGTRDYNPGRPGGNPVSLRALQDHFRDSFLGPLSLRIPFVQILYDTATTRYHRIIGSTAEINESIS